jgi:hypothetical protein
VACGLVLAVGRSKWEVKNVLGGTDGAGVYMAHSFMPAVNLSGEVRRSGAGMRVCAATGRAVYAWKTREAADAVYI